MPQITIIDRSGEEQLIDAPIGVTLMEIIRDNGFDELLALCGGCCSCATCHVHIDPATIVNLPTITADENDLLDSSDNRDRYSRLSCQIEVTEALDGARVVIAQED